MEVTIRINLINRFKPQGLADYKKKRSMKLPVHLRCSANDKLNHFVKTIHIWNKDRVQQQVNEEVSRIMNVANFQVKSFPDYGDKYIGDIDVRGYDDCLFTCFVPVSSNKFRNESSLRTSKKLEDKAQLKLF